jgi:hypothetical protein
MDSACLILQRQLFGEFGRAPVYWPGCDLIVAATPARRRRPFGSGSASRSDALFGVDAGCDSLSRIEKDYGSHEWDVELSQGRRS